VHAYSQNLNVSSSMNLTRFLGNVFSVLILGPGKEIADTGSRLLRCSQVEIVGWITHHLMSYALDGGKLLVPTLWNWVRFRCCASIPDAERRSCIVRTLRFLFIDGDTASYLGSFELLKICCLVQDICTHLANCHLDFVRKHWIEILRCIYASLTEVEVIRSIDGGVKNNSDVVLNQGQI
jgi:hypothetical protein